MGLDYLVSVGPFFKCKFEMVTKDHKYRTCTNDACTEFKKEHGEAKFCHNCSRLIAMVAIPKEMESVNAAQVIEDMGHTLRYQNIRQPGIDVYISNSNSDKATFDPCGGDVYYRTSDDINIDKEVEDFNLKFAKERIELQEQYGEENVQTVWGIFNDVF